MKRVICFLLATFFTLFFGSIASAHVTILPKEATQGSYEKFTVRVPTEKDVPTVKVEVKIPADADITRFEPKSGWKYEITKDASGKITSVVWTATGGGLSSTEFGEFNMQGKIVDNVNAITWKAYQTYKDGSVVEWAGAEGSDKPASVTNVKPKAAGTSSTGPENAAATSAMPVGAMENSNLPLYLSIAALFAGLFSLIVSLRRKVENRPSPWMNDQRSIASSKVHR